MLTSTSGGDMKSTNNSLPFERSYWVKPERLLAGCYPGSKDHAGTERNMKALLDCGIRSIINLMEPDETDHSGKPFRPYDDSFSNLARERGLDISWTRVPVRDLNIPSTETMRRILDLIDASINEGKPVYVHCWGGRGRTGTVVGCYLVRHEGLSGEDALEEIKRLRANEPTSYKSSPENRHQCDMVRTWKEIPKRPPVNDGEFGKGDRVPQKPDKITRTEQTISLLDRYLGCLVGLAACDAVGTTLEFKSPGTFKPITDMIGGGPFNLKPGQWTDDTSMALCLATSLIEKKDFDPKDQMEKYVRWHKEGYMSANGKCFDIGNATRSALSNFLKTGNPFSGSNAEYSAGNGSLMRLAPVPLFYAKNPKQAITKSGESSRTTHPHPACVDACRYFAGLIVGALRGASKKEILSEKYCPVEGYWTQNLLHPEILPIAEGDYKRKQPPQINGKGYVVRTLEAALWAFYSTESFEEGCLKVVNLGDDADTTGAVYGQIAGAFYGYNAIPTKWMEKLAKKDLLEDTAKGLFEAANGGKKAEKEPVPSAERPAEDGAAQKACEVEELFQNVSSLIRPYARKVHEMLVELQPGCVPKVCAQKSTPYIAYNPYPDIFHLDLSKSTCNLMIDKKLNLIGLLQEAGGKIKERKPRWIRLIISDDVAVSALRDALARNADHVKEQLKLNSPRTVPTR